MADQTRRRPGSSDSSSSAKRWPDLAMQSRNPNGSLNLKATVPGMHGTFTCHVDRICNRCTSKGKSSRKLKRMRPIGVVAERNVGRRAIGRLFARPDEARSARRCGSHW
jgi:hypothetical protein